MMRRTLCVLGLCCLPLAEAMAEGDVRVWRTSYRIDSGSNNCFSGPADVWESPRTFSLHLENSNWEIWSVRLAADGSADQEFIAQGIKPSDKPHIRVIIPAGRGPRTFKIINSTHGCDYTLVPGGYIK
jgi:hypothetical protein